jgi:hypothetical protein
MASSSAAVSDAEQAAHFPAPPAAVVALTERAAALGVAWSSAAAAMRSDAAYAVAHWAAPLRQDWFGGGSGLVRDEASLLRERAARTAGGGGGGNAKAAAAAAAARRAAAVPLPGSATAHATGRALHAQPAARAPGLWALPVLPTDADTAAEAWADAVKEASATRLDEQQAALAASSVAAAQHVRASVATAEREAARELAQSKARACVRESARAFVRAFARNRPALVRTSRACGAARSHARTRHAHTPRTVAARARGRRGCATQPAWPRTPLPL